MEDYQHVKGFLWSKCRKSEPTYNAFRSESERFLLWPWIVKERLIAFLKKRDIEDYIDFVVKPPKSWIGLQARAISQAAQAAFEGDHGLLSFIEF